MNATSALPAKDSSISAGNPAVAPTVLVWDAPVRVFHWLMVVCFAGAYLTSESETWRLVHVTLGNPAGAVAIVAMLALTATIAATGWATYDEVAGEWVAELHEVVANGMLLLVGFHIAAVVVSGWLHHENLARAMLTGRKGAASNQGVHSAWRTVATLLVVAVVGFWYLQWCRC